MCFASALHLSSSSLWAQSRPGFNSTLLSPLSVAGVNALTEGPDGAIWLAAASDQLFGVIGRLTTSGVLTTAALPLNDESSAITSGPDGNLWFTVSFAGASGTGVDSIGKITPGLSMTLYPLPSARFVSDGIVAGPDGALWFTEINGNGIGRITTSGLITQYPLPGAPNQTFGITVGADRALWFAYNVAGAGGYFVGSIGRITTSGLVSIYPVPSTYGTNGITAGADGNLWFTEGAGVGRSTTPGVITEFSTEADYGPQWITARNNALWFNAVDEQNEAAVVQMNTSGEIVGTTPAPLAAASLRGIAVGPGNAIWISNNLFPGLADIAQLVTASADMRATPSGPTPTTPISISGSGFAPSETVVLSVDSITAGRVETVAASGSGSFGATLTLGQASTGYHTIFAAGETSKRLGIATLTVTSELTVSPSSVAPGGTISVEGYGFSPFATLSVTLSNTTPLGKPEANIKGTFSGGSGISYTIPAGTSPGVYTINATVRSNGGGSASTTFTVE